MTKYFKIEVYKGKTTRPAFFREEPSGDVSFGLGWVQYAPSIYKSRQEAIADFQMHLQKEHNQKQDGITVAVSHPIDVTEYEVYKNRPSSHE